MELQTRFYILHHASGNGHSHIPDGKAPELRDLFDLLDAHWLNGLDGNNRCISCLDEIWILSSYLTCLWIKLLEDCCDHTSNLRCMAVYNRCISCCDC